MSAKTKKKVVKKAPTKKPRKPRGPVKVPEGVNIKSLKPRPMYGISWVDAKKQGRVGWFVRIGPVTDRQQGFFSVGPYGGKQAALDAAQIYRNNLWKSLPDGLKWMSSKKRKARK